MQVLNLSYSHSMPCSDALLKAAWYASGDVPFQMTTEKGAKCAGESKVCLVEDDTGNSKCDQETAYSAGLLITLQNTVRVVRAPSQEHTTRSCHCCIGEDSACGSQGLDNLATTASDTGC